MLIRKFFFIHKLAIIHETDGATFIKVIDIFEIPENGHESLMSWEPNFDFDRCNLLFLSSLHSWLLTPLQKNMLGHLKMLLLLFSPFHNFLFLIYLGFLKSFISQLYSQNYGPQCARNLIMIRYVMEGCTYCSDIVTLRREIRLCDVVWGGLTLGIPTYNNLNSHPPSLHYITRLKEISVYT